jgi:hypothetical protein
VPDGRPIDSQPPNAEPPDRKPADRSCTHSQRPDRRQTPRLSAGSGSRPSLRPKESNPASPSHPPTVATGTLD